MIDRIFKAYDVRATYPTPLNEEMAWKVGHATAQFLKRSRQMLGPEQRVARDLSLAQSNRPRNIDYWFCGDSAIKPVAAADDGIHTRLRFAPKAELPAIFVNNDDGSESLLNFNMDAGDVVIHRVAARFIVRRGRLTGCIVNKHFAGGGERLESGTIAPEVSRERKEIAP